MSITDKTLRQPLRNSTLHRESQDRQAILSTYPNPSCVLSLSSILQKHKLAVTPEGKFYRVLPYNRYRKHLLQMCSLIMIGFLLHLIRRFPYHHITLIGNSVYSKVSASTLLCCDIPFALCKSNNRITYYETENKKEVAFEGPSLVTFLETLNPTKTLIPVIPLSNEEILKLEQHTGLNNLTTIQTSILSNFTIRNGVYLADLPNIVNSVKPDHNPVVHIKKIFGNLYYVTTTNETWLTRLIITDTVIPLQPGEIISTLYANITETSSSDYNIAANGDKQIIFEPSSQTELVRQDSYIVNPDLSIKHFTYDDLKESIIYSLNPPRPFIHNSIYLIHPFYLPTTWDPFLTIMIVTRSLLSLIN